MGLAAVCVWMCGKSEGGERVCVGIVDFVGGKDLTYTHTHLEKKARSIAICPSSTSLFFFFLSFVGGKYVNLHALLPVRA